MSDSDKAHVFLGLSTQGKGESAKIAAKFIKQQFKAIDLTHDELAKEHIRHMAGGIRRCHRTSACCASSSPSASAPCSNS